MSRDKMELILNNVLLALQLSLGLWQFMKLTPVGAVIQGLIGWLLRPLGFSPNYSLVQHCPGRVFKRANCFALQADIPSDRRDIVSPEVHSIDIGSPEVHLIKLNYLDRDFLLERSEEDRNMLIINKKMCYYITDTIWEELQRLKRVLHYSLDGPPMARVAVAQAAVKRTQDASAAAEVAATHATTDAAAAAEAAADAAAAIYSASDDAAADTAAAAVAAADAAATVGVNHNHIARFVFDGASDANDKAAEAKAAAEDKAAAEVRAAANAEARAAAANARAAAEARAVDAAEARAAAAANAKDATAARTAAVAEATAAVDAEAKAAKAAKDAGLLKTVFVKGNKHFWAGMITGGVMTLEEVFDELILYNHHVGGCLTINWLLPVNLSVSEEKLLKILNLVALFLQTKKVVKVPLFIPTLLSLTSAFLEFSTRWRVWLYNHINVLFCHMMHFICDRLPRSWRRQIYSLGKWVENLTPCNDIQLKVVRGNISAIITEGAKVDKVDKEGAKVNKKGTIRCNMCSSTEGANVDKKPAILVPFSDISFNPSFGVIEKQFLCRSIERQCLCVSIKEQPIMISCIYVIEHHLCEISAPEISVFFVKCQNEDHFSRIIALVSSIAESRCGSLISYDPNNNKVRVRGFEESITYYVNSGLPSIYELELMNVVVA